ncbi:hypothetical protein BD410DRAFT_793415 [Rickenella mellea]|uniref:Uncharacterized protein n=1 Tax=Rickenella mellea TaxID=50990 RepID=A0A4Y7PU22_9AGAM|nr:hypothetical protein BD410DRAFT_793415 [Rickenella mellea]
MNANTPIHAYSFPSYGSAIMSYLLHLGFLPHTLTERQIPPDRRTSWSLLELSASVPSSSCYRSNRTFYANYVVAQRIFDVDDVWGKRLSVSTASWYRQHIRVRRRSILSLAFLRHTSIIRYVNCNSSEYNISLDLYKAKGTTKDDSVPDMLASEFEVQLGFHHDVEPRSNTLSSY